MYKRIPIKNHLQEIQLVTQRSIVALVILALLVLALVGRLLYLQIYKHNVYTTLATHNWLDLVPNEPTRGLIFDRNGVMLAENIPVFSLDITPYEVRDILQTIANLKKIITLTDNDITQFNKQLKQH